MVDLNSELRATLLDSGVTISDQLADEIISWGIRYIEDNVGIPLEGRQEITEEEQAEIEAWFAVPANALAYGTAFSQQPFYPEYLQALMNATPTNPEPPTTPPTETPENPDTPVLVSEQDLEAWLTAVAVAYRGFLNTEPTNALINQWVANYFDNVSSADLIQGYFNQLSPASPTEAPEAWLEDLYQALLGRSADDGGKAYWLGQLEQGVAASTIITLFTLSAEAATAYAEAISSTINTANDVGSNGLSVQQSITALYESLLGRTPDDEGIAFWQAQLSAQADTDDLSPLIESFLDSEEFASLAIATNEALLDLLYTNLLQRPADDDGLAYWLGQLNDGVSPSAVVEAMIESDEYLSLLGMADTDPMVA